MTEARYVSGARLRVIIAAAGRSDKAVRAATTALERHRACNFRVEVVPTAQMLDVYSRRLANPRFSPVEVLGAERMLEDFADCDDESLAMLSAQDGSVIVGMWLTRDLDRLVTLFVGPDRRFGETESTRGGR